MLIDVNIYWINLYFFNLLCIKKLKAINKSTLLSFFYEFKKHLKISYCILNSIKLF